MPDGAAATTTGRRFGPAAERVAERLWGVVVGGAFAIQLIAAATGIVEIAILALVAAGVWELFTPETTDPLRQRLRRVGLGLEVRVLIRALLLLAAAGTPSQLGAASYAGGIVLLFVVARLSGWLTRKLTLEQPPQGLLNLGEDLELKRYLDVVRGDRAYELGLLCFLEVVLAIGVYLDVSDDVVAAVAVNALVMTGSIAVAAMLVRRFRRFARGGALERYVESLRRELDALDTDVAVYFSGDQDATYQLTQWMPVFERLPQRPLLILRERHHVESFPDTPLPTLYCRRHQDVEIALSADPQVVLYVGNAGRNIHFLRYARPKHVFLNHGDSDKISSANPVVKVYDRLFVAGEIAIERYRAAGIDLPDERFRVVGRPQLDGVLDGRRRLGEGPTTLLYAPTWEGYFEAADYSSLERQGVALIRRVLDEHPDVRIVFKPHPMSGTVRPGARAALEKVSRLLRDAGSPHVVATDHPELDLLAWFDRSDVLLSDISAVVTDWLHTDKPYLATNPRGMPTDEFHARFPSHRAAYLVGSDLAGLDEGLRAALGDDPASEARGRMKRAVLGDHADGPFASFELALSETVEWARHDAARVRNTFSYD